MSKNLFKLISMLFERDIISRILLFLHQVIQFHKWFDYLRFEQALKTYFQSFQSEGRINSSVYYSIIYYYYYYFCVFFDSMLFTKIWNELTISLEEFISEIFTISTYNTFDIYCNIWDCNTSRSSTIEASNRFGS